MRFFSFKSNKNYILPFGKEIDEWEEIREIENIVPKPLDICAVLDSVKIEFEKDFGSEHVNNRTVVIFPCKSNPVSYPAKNLIFLSARGRRWNSYVYEFSHELCHLMIGNTDRDLGWFVESICELASFFYLRRLGTVWRHSPPYPNWSTYAPKMHTYFELESEKAVKLGEQKSLSQFIHEQDSYLRANSEQRSINALCALEMLPHFESAPNLWKDVVNLSKISKTGSLGDFFDEWIQLSANKEMLRKLKALFCSV